MNTEELITKVGKGIQNTVRLGEAEKASIRMALQSHIAVSVRNTAPTTSSVSEPLYKARLSRTKHNPIMIIAAIIGLMFSGGAAFAAESALPGDALYPIKIHVNEEFRAAVAISAEADAKWEARRAERRLEEVEKLKAKSKLTAEARAELSSGFESHSKAFAEDKAKAVVESEGKTEVNAELNADFEAKLRAHQSALIDITGQNKMEESMDDAVDAAVDATLKGTISTGTRESGGHILPVSIKIGADGKLEAQTQGGVKAVVPEDLYPVDPIKQDTDASASGVIQVDAGGAKAETKIKSKTTLGL